jgi:hypothetical protein
MFLDKHFSFLTKFKFDSFFNNPFQHNLYISYKKAFFYFDKTYAP